jgi:hypothetical protein
MNLTRTKNFESECPYLNRIHSISINYAEFPIAGQLSNSFKKIDYSCSENVNCTFKDQYDRCPVYKSAPESP